MLCWLGFREKKARFPKGRKTKRGDDFSELEQDELATSRRAQQAAKERAQRRNQKREQDLLLRDSDPADIFGAEVDYEVFFFLLLFSFSFVFNWH